MIACDAFSFLLEALLDPGTCVVLGAGASAPDLPLVGQIADAVGPHAVEVGSYPAERLPPSPARSLIKPAHFDLSFLEYWKRSQLTDAAANLCLAQIFGRQRPCPPQYTVFRCFAHEMIAFSFNWDGLAEQCMSQVVISPHGVAKAPCRDDEFVSLLEDAQLFDESGSSLFRSPGLVYPGEEATATRPYQRVLEIVLRHRTKLVVIGYGFGLLAEHDRVWREILVGVTSKFPTPTVFVSPDARELTGCLEDFARHSLTLPVVANWYHFSRALHRLWAQGVCTRSMIADSRQLQYEYHRLADDA